MSKWLKKLDLKSLLLGVAVAGLLGIATWALAVFFEGPGRGEAWPAAISAVSSFVLVVVTTIYAGITGRSVRLQEISIADLRRQEEARAVRRVLDTVYPWTNEVTGLLRLFPLGKSDAMPDKDLILNKTLVQAGTELRAISVRLPQDLKLQSTQAAVLLLRAYTQCQVIVLCVGDARLSLRKQQVDALEANTKEAGNLRVEPTWEQVRAAFYSDAERRRRLAVEGEPLPEWDDLSAGKVISAAEAALEQLETDLAAWLMESTGPLGKDSTNS